MWPGIPDTYEKLPESDSGSFRYTRSRDYQTPTRHALLGSGRRWKTGLLSSYVQRQQMAHRGRSVISAIALFVQLRRQSVNTPSVRALRACRALTLMRMWLPTNIDRTLSSGMSRQRRTWSLRYTRWSLLSRCLRHFRQRYCFHRSLCACLYVCQ